VALDAADAVPGRKAVTAGLLLSMAVIAAEVTVVATALPTVVGELRGLELYPWVYSAYLLTSTVTVPVFGKLADLYGRKRIFLGGMALFMLASMLCGLATSMPQLVAFRALQGLGAGAVQPLVFTIIGDIYPLRERGKIQGFMAGVWGIASLAGPALGAFLTLTLSWRYVFFVGAPIGLVGAVVVARYFRERAMYREAKVDYAGAATLSAALAILMIAVLEGGRVNALLSPPVLGAVALSAGLLALFVRIERRTSEPILPLTLFREPIVSVSSIGNLLGGAQLFALSAYIPLYVQGVRGETAAGAGAVMTPMLVAWSASSVFGPKLLLRIGFRGTALFATTMLLLGSLLLLTFDRDTSALVITTSMILLGVGFGPSMAAFVVAVQAAVPWEVRGVATSTMQLCRSLGGTVLVAVLGALLTSRLADAVGGRQVDTSALLNESARQGMRPDELAALQVALSDGLRLVFTVLVALAAVCVVVMLRYARGDARQWEQAPDPPRPVPEAAARS
jgi:EmrB/QacA subfamily drug resistance transporter